MYGFDPGLCTAVVNLPLRIFSECDIFWIGIWSGLKLALTNTKGLFVSQELDRKTSENCCFVGVITLFISNLFVCVEIWRVRIGSFMQRTVMILLVMNCSLELIDKSKWEIKENLFCDEAHNHKTCFYFSLSCSGLSISCDERPTARMIFTWP